MSWKNVKIDKEKLMDVKGRPVQSAGLSLIFQHQMFDVDLNGLPVFTDKNIALLNLLINNDVSYAGVIESDYGKEMASIFKGMFDAGSWSTRQTNIRRAVYRVNRDNSTSLPTLSNSDKNDSAGKPTQAELIKLLGISAGMRVDGKTIEEVKAEAKKDGKKNGGGKKNAENEKILTGGSLLTAVAIMEMIASGDDSHGNDNAFREALLAGQSDLVYKIAHAAEIAVNDALGRESLQAAASKLGKKEIVKNNYSFATKFCHHACRGISGGAGKYCIYDSVVHDFLPYYACEYIEADTLGIICGFKPEHTTFNERYKKVYEQIDAWKKLSAQDASEKGEGYGYENYRNLYDATLDGINRWRDAWRLCPNSQGNVIDHQLNDDQYEKLDYCSFDRFVWYFFKNQWRKEKAKGLLKNWKKLPCNM